MTNLSDIKERAVLSTTETITRDLVRAQLQSCGDANADWEVVSRLLLDRFSCRAFRPDRLSKETLEAIFAPAQFTANWCNAQPWKVYVTQGDATERFRDALVSKAREPGAGSSPDVPFPLRYDGVYGERRRDAGVALYKSVGIAREDKLGAARQMLENYRLFGAPHVAIIATEADLGTYGAVDCGIYLANIMLLMQSLGVASIPQGALPRFSPLIRAFFNIPDNLQVLCGISFGYADEAHPVNSFRTTRGLTSAAVSWVGD